MKLDGYLPELIEKEHFMMEIFYCLGEQGFSFPKDFLDLYTLIIKAICAINAGIDFAYLLKLPIEIGFYNIFSRMDITYHNYFINPEVSPNPNIKRQRSAE